MLNKEVILKKMSFSYKVYQEPILKQQPSKMACSVERVRLFPNRLGLLKNILRL